MKVRNIFHNYTASPLLMTTVCTRVRYTDRNAPLTKTRLNNVVQHLKLRAFTSPLKTTWHHGNYSKKPTYKDKLNWSHNLLPPRAQKALPTSLIGMTGFWRHFLTFMLDIVRWNFNISSSNSSWLRTDIDWTSFHVWQNSFLWLLHFVLQNLTIF